MRSVLLLPLCAALVGTPFVRPASAAAEPPDAAAEHEANAQRDAIPDVPAAYEHTMPDDLDTVDGPSGAAEPHGASGEHHGGAEVPPGPTLAGEACVASGLVDRGERYFGRAHGPTAQSSVAGAVPVGPGELGVDAWVGSLLAGGRALDPASETPTWRIDLGAGWAFGAGPVELGLGYALVTAPEGERLAVEHELAAELAFDLPVRPILEMAVMVSPEQELYLSAGAEHEAELVRNVDLSLGAGVGAAVGVGEAFHGSDAHCEARLAWRFADPFVLSLSGQAALDIHPTGEPDEQAADEGHAQAQDTPVTGEPSFDVRERLTFVGAIALAFEL